MNKLNDPLAQLKDIHLPPPVGWWPPAPGWWLVGICLLAVVVGGGYFLWKLFRRGRYRREALLCLRHLHSTHQGQEQLFLEEVSRLLRQVAICQYGRQEVALLNSSEWLKFLDRTGKTDQFSQGAGKVLGTMLYQPAVVIEADQLCRVAEAWIRRQRRC